MGYIRDPEKLIEEFNSLGILDFVHQLRDNSAQLPKVLECDSPTSVDRLRFMFYGFFKSAELKQYRIEYVNSTTIRIVRKKSMKVNMMDNQYASAFTVSTQEPPDIPLPPTMEDIMKMVTNDNDDLFGEGLGEGEKK